MKILKAIQNERSFSMKKILAAVLVLTMALIFAACGGEDKPQPSQQIEPAPQSENQPESTPEDSTNEMPSDPTEALLYKTGLKLSDIEPNEEYYRAAADSEKIVFYMEKETERNTAVYLRKLVAACEKASDNGEVYVADTKFFMGGEKTLLELPSDEEINGYMMYLAQFGYVKDGSTFTVTFGNVDDFDPERNDEVYYPTYSVAIGII
jgi:hypothetical protein